MGAQFDKYFERLEPFLASTEPNADGEIRMRCPLHDDEHPSASINVDKDVFNCLVCGGSSIKELSYAMFETEDNVKDLEAHRQKKSGKPIEQLSEGKVFGWHEYLKTQPKLLDYLRKDRGLTNETIAHFLLGYDHSSYRTSTGKQAKTNRFTLPVFDEQGVLRNVRKYKPDADASQKMWNARGHGTPPRLYPAENLHHETIVVCEGEWDALVTTQHGIPAVTGTHGARTWDTSWTPFFKGKDVVVIYDNDKEGRFGSKKASDALRKVAKSVRVVVLPLEEEHADLTDWFVGGHTADELRELMAGAPAAPLAGAAALDQAPLPITVAQSMSANYAGKPVAMPTLLIGRRDPAYAVPRRAKLTCDMKAGAKCKVCPMLSYEGEHEVKIEPKDVPFIARFLDEPEAKRVNLLRERVGAQPCRRLQMESLESFTVEELTVSQSIDRLRDEVGDPIKRRVYNITTDENRARINAPAMITGTVHDSPKDARIEFFGWQLEETETNIDRFRMTPELRDALQVFQPSAGQTPLQKMREIAVDLSSNVTQIVGRERLHMAMDLVWHSLLRFRFENKVISRGWLEFLVVGDTRTGKSETAIRLMEHYGLGQLIGCESTTLAGLVGGVQQVRNSWVITWGALPLNNRRLVVLDEVNGLKPEEISLLSDIRSRGVAQITKVVSHQTEARVRAIYIGNPRANNDRYFGIDMIRDLVGQPEDIARFDFAMSVRSEDVPGTLINTPDHSHVPHVYTSDLSHSLVLWAWSRTAEQVEFSSDAVANIYKCADWLGTHFVEEPPLVQRANVREKVVRMAVALAARTFSTDETGTKVIVTKQHVSDATRFLVDLYSYERFGYRTISARAMFNAKQAGKQTRKIKHFLKHNRQLTEFLIDNRDTFRLNDLEEMAGMFREEASKALTILSNAKMIRKEKGNIHLNPPLVALLAEIEKEQNRL